MCRGCKRFAHEVVAWNGYSEEEKAVVMERLSSLAAQVIADKINVVNAQLLQEQLDQRGIEVSHPGGDTQRVLALLRAAAGQLDIPENFGLKLSSEMAALSPLRMRDRIDTDFYELSEAHYERYIKV